MLRVESTTSERAGITIELPADPLPAVPEWAVTGPGATSTLAEWAAGEWATAWDSRNGRIQAVSALIGQGEALDIQPGGNYDLHFRYKPADQLKPFVMRVGSFCANRVLSDQTPDGMLVSDAAVMPVFVEDSLSGRVVKDNTYVFAGTGSTVEIDASVTSFLIGKWPDRPNWTAASAPTLVTPGATQDASVATGLSGSNGDVVMLAKSGTVWYATAVPVAGGGPTTDDDGFFYDRRPLGPASVWTIVHGLPFNPAGINVRDTSGDTVRGYTVTHPTIGTTTLTFGSDQDGEANLS